MTGKIVSAKELREAFRKEILVGADVSPDAKKTKRILGGKAEQMTIGKAVRILDAVRQRFEADGRTLDKSMVDLLTPRGARRYASSQLNGLAAVKLVRGANAIETVFRLFQQ